MKKLPEDYQLRQNRIIGQRLHRLNRKKKARTRELKPGLIARILHREPVKAPEEVSFFPKFADSVIRFVKNIRNICASGKKAHLDFSNTKRVTATGAVYLYSEIETLSRKFGPKVVMIDRDSCSNNTWVLHQAGLLKLANGFPPPSKVILPVRSGTEDEHFEDILHYLITRAIQDRQLWSADPLEAEKLAGYAIKEAMLNVKYHAYPDATEKRWWTTAAIIKDSLYIALCDRGVGIPKTLPGQSWYENLMRSVRLTSDAEMIRAAMQYTRSRETAKPRRGLGTRDIQNLVLSKRTGYLTVVSGKGHYRLSGEDAKETIQSIGYNVDGTVIQWAIPLSGPAESEQSE